MYGGGPLFEKKKNIWNDLISMFFFKKRRPLSKMFFKQNVITILTHVLMDILNVLVCNLKK